tara:strand:+ start:2432 stop:3205 length:774 start_codon:yes stop_codon:yes gene_type:complete
LKYLYVNGDSYPCGDELPNSREHMNHINRQHVLGEGRFSQFVCDKLNLIEYNYSQPGVSFTRTMRQTIDFIHLFPEKIKDTFFIICLTSCYRTDEFDGHTPELEPTDFFIIKNIREIITLQSFLKQNKVKYCFLDAFSQKFKNYAKTLDNNKDDKLFHLSEVNKIQETELLDNLKSSKVRKYLPIFDNEGKIKPVDLSKLYKIYFDMIDFDHVLFPKGYSSILDIQILENDFLKNLHPSEKTHRIISECVIDFIRNN